jgi:hypothetical protein
MVKDFEVRVFLIHLAAFIAGTLICAAINLWLTPDTLWFPWVLLGWGAAIATHAFALFLRRTRRRERIFLDPKARKFAVHLFAYVATVLILLYVNLTVTPEVWWFYWVALGWGAVHLLQKEAQSADASNSAARGGCAKVTSRQEGLGAAPKQRSRVAPKRKAPQPAKAAPKSKAAKKRSGAAPKRTSHATPKRKTKRKKSR